jgi:predicted RND superfamily exporter protein
MTFRPWNQIANAICRFSGPITLTCLVVMALTVWGVSRVTTSVSVRNLLTPKSRIVRDYRWLEANVVPLVPVEVILHFPQDCSLDLLQRLELVRSVQEEITQIESVEGATSAATFFARIPATGGGRATMQRTLLRRRLEAQFDRLVEAGLVHRSPEQQSWRVSTRVPAMGNLDYGLFLDELRQRVEPLLQARPQEGVAATYTGLTPLVYVAQRALLNDMFASFLTALFFVAVVMVLVQRSVSVGLLAMIPNVFPAAVLFGVMGWLRIQVDIGSVMTASVALGIAVDDSIHFLTWFRRERCAGCAPPEAVRRAFHHCAGAMIQTTVICGLGLLVFALSDFLPVRRFAWMILTLLLAALAGDLVLLPAMLAGPLGRLLPRWDVSAGSQADARSN